ncbi:MAG: hypothetical protein AAFU79_17945 [Myxococcota bacterium]
MATLTIRRLDDEVRDALRVRAAQAGRSMEDEARTILTRAVRGMNGPELLQRVSELFGENQGLSEGEAGLLAESRDTGARDVALPEGDENG